MNTTAQRRSKLRVGGIWHDAHDNKVEIKRLAYGRVHFEILELQDRQPKLASASSIRIGNMEDRIVSMPISQFIHRTNFDCLSMTGMAQHKIY